jgi:hypothetical protein
MNRVIPRSSDNGKMIRSVTEVVALLMKQPRTMPELIDATGRNSNRGWNRNISLTIKALHGEGLIYVQMYRRQYGVSGPSVAVWAWQPSVCAMEDAQRPGIAAPVSIRPQLRRAA